LREGTRVITIWEGIMRYWAKLFVVMALAIVSGIGATMLVPKPAAGAARPVACPANHKRCFAGGCVGAVNYNCDWDLVNGVCTTTWYGSDPSCTT
ncbi:MAG TPA: hypothetical protein VF042_14230, partial [Gemmatimonadaceae bacterium]